MLATSRASKKAGRGGRSRIPPSINDERITYEKYHEPAVDADRRWREHKVYGKQEFGKHLIRFLQSPLFSARAAQADARVIRRHMLARKIFCQHEFMRHILCMPTLR